MYTYPYNWTARIYPDSTYSWYGLPDKLTNGYQVRDLLIGGNRIKGLDPGYSVTTSTCQDVILNLQKTYSLSFNYLIDENIDSSTLTVYWRNTVLLEEIVTSKVPLYFTYEVV